MNVRERLYAAKKVRDLIKKGSRNSVKCRHGPAEGAEHKALKWLVCCELYELGVDFWTEAEFFGGGVSDIVVEPWGVCLEVLSSEESKRFRAKAYPLPTIAIRTFRTPGEIRLMLGELAQTGGGAAQHYVDRWAPENYLKDDVPE